MGDETSRQSAAQIEGVKLTYDFLKHMTTLSAGAIVILATFASRLPSTRQSSAAGFAVGCLVVSIVASMFSASLYALGDKKHELIPPTGATLGTAAIAFLIGAVAFVLAFINLARFAAANIG